MSIQHDGFSYDVEMTKRGLLLSRRDHCSGEIIQYPISAEQGEDLRKQLEDALKDPLEELLLPWGVGTDGWFTQADGRSGLRGKAADTLAKAFASLSEAEQREFLMRGLS